MNGRLLSMTMKRLIALFVGLAALTGVLVFATRQAQLKAAPASAFTGPTETAVFAGGCFWGLQAAFDEMPGVVSTRAGYAGGSSINPTYEQVVAGKTGHAEAVEVVFDPARVSFEQVARCFFAHHRSTSDEPETSYRKRAYRSAIFVSSSAQREVAERVRDEVVERNAGEKPVATLIENATTFWEAEAYQQKYLAKCAH